MWDELWHSNTTTTHPSGKEGWEMAQHVHGTSIRDMEDDTCVTSEVDGVEVGRVGSDACSSQGTVDLEAVVETQKKRNETQRPTRPNGKNKKRRRGDIPCVRPGMKKVTQDRDFGNDAENIRKKLQEVILPIYQEMQNSPQVKVELESKEGEVRVQMIPWMWKRCNKTAKTWQCSALAPPGHAACLKHKIHAIMNGYPPLYKLYVPDEVASMFPMSIKGNRPTHSKRQPSLPPLRTASNGPLEEEACSHPVRKAPKAKATKRKRDPVFDTPEDAALYHQVLWVKQKGYPFWPAQVVDRKNAKVPLPPSIYQSQLDAVQFFGTRDYGLLRPKFPAMSWAEGLRKNLDTAKLRSLRFAIEEAKSFLNPELQVKPDGWWNVEPMVELLGDFQEELPLPAAQVPAWPPGDMMPVEAADFAVPGYVLDSRLPQYTSIRKSVWTHVLAPRRLPSEEIEVCNCMPSSHGAPSCGEDCMNRRTFVACDPKTCPCGSSCTNRPFHMRKSPKLAPFLTEHCGWGVITKEPIDKGSFVIEYVGEIIDEKECENRLWEAKARGERNFYLMEINSSTTIDARHKSNIARLINSSCKPNCETQKWHDAATGEVRVGIFALRDVQAGEQLTYDYQFEHYGETNATSFLCRCGAADCRGRLDKIGRGRYRQGHTVFVRFKDGIFHEGKVLRYIEEKESFAITFWDGRKETLRLRPKMHFWSELGRTPLEDKPAIKHEDVGRGLTFTTEDRTIAGVVVSYLPDVDAHEVLDDEGQRWYVSVDAIPHAWHGSDPHVEEKGGSTS